MRVIKLLELTSAYADLDKVIIARIVGRPNMDEIKKEVKRRTKIAKTLNQDSDKVNDLFAEEFEVPISENVEIGFIGDVVSSLDCSQFSLLENSLKEFRQNGKVKMSCNDYWD